MAQRSVFSILILLLLIACAGKSNQTDGSDNEFVGMGVTHATATEAVDPGSCPVSNDPTYGQSLDNPVNVGGEVLGSQRSRAYLLALRGPAGEGLRYERLGSKINGNEDIIDVWAVIYDGLDRPIVLFINQYAWEQPVVPSGLTCAGEIPLKPVEP